MYGCMYGNTRWRFGVSTPTKRWTDFSGLLHLIRVLKLKLSGYSSSFQPRAQVVRFVTLVNLPFQFYSEVFATACDLLWPLPCVHVYRTRVLLSFQCETLPADWTPVPGTFCFRLRYGVRNTFVSLGHLGMPLIHIARPPLLLLLLLRHRCHPFLLHQGFVWRHGTYIRSVINTTLLLTLY